MNMMKGMSPEQQAHIAKMAQNHGMPGMGGMPGGGMPGMGMGGMPGMGNMP
jgi:signal recognition particle subunit SRP54